MTGYGVYGGFDADFQWKGQASQKPSLSGEPADKEGSFAHITNGETIMLRYLDFDVDAVKRHFDERPPQEGDLLILAMPQFHQNRFRLVRVRKASHGRQRRIIIDNPCCYAGASYYRTGKSCFAPKGQTRLLPYVEHLADLLIEGKDTKLSYAQIAEYLKSP